MKALVTGAAGFIGSHLCERLIADGHQVVGLDDLSGGKLSNLDSLKNNSKFFFVKADIQETIELPPHFDWVFHLAAKSDVVPSIEKPTEYHDTNVTGTLRLLKWATDNNVKKFIYSASSSCYGIPDSYPTEETAPCNPMYPYALTKYLGEQYVLHWAQVYGLPAISLRLFNVYGPRARTNGNYGAVFGTFLSQLANSKPLTVVGDGKQSRDFTFVTDVVEAFLKAAKSDLKRDVINIASGIPQSVNRLVDLLGPTTFEHIPDRPGEPRMTWGWGAEARDKLGWKPLVSFEQGVSLMKVLVHEYKEAPLWTKESIKTATESWFKYMGDK